MHRIAFPLGLVHPCMATGARLQPIVAHANQRWGTLTVDVQSFWAIWRALLLAREHGSEQFETGFLSIGRSSSRRTGAVEYQWHDHPLQLRSILSDSNAQCFLCFQSISGYNYRCTNTNCNYSLHITCLKLPLQALHPLHLPHPLTLLQHPPDHPTCHQCTTPCSNFTYSCTSCPFSLHLHCATEQRNFTYKIHNHPLSFSAAPPSGFLSFICNVCGDDGQCFNLQCKICPFVVHIECSVLPVTVNYSSHEHPFKLITVRSIEDGTGEFYCDVCEERVNPKGCIYYCEDCVYIGHLGCMASAQKPLVKLAYKEVGLPSVEFESSYGIAQNHPIELRSDPTKVDRGGDEMSKLRVQYDEHHLNEIEHFSHQHSLRHIGEHEMSKFSCFACWGNISGAGFGCTQCNFYLHKWCAELPQSIKHPIHPAHSLTLGSRARGHFCQCDACDEACDGFTYYCETCYFNLHSMCASIPSSLANEIHQHPLTLSRKRPYSTSCKACGNECTGTVFECEACDLVLDFKCALLPYTVMHRCHVDPLRLTFVGVGDDESDEFYCDACEQRRDPTHWVYYCKECEFSAHMSCVVSELLGGFPLPGLLQFDHHEHLISLVTKVPPQSS
ncbi:hypothetical protein RJ639_002009 [Escallonia herrerae]|uniref:Zinc finger PHD-type domain-containing protein n=1 Tax=Escallonia herrerae TaxID=1293975 RepID=A0AA88XRT8_9ASTE|nr:hypothetical protein RJ639_002009 [Escallonia herrerae]